MWGVAVLPNFEGGMKGLDLFRVGSGLWIALNWDFVKELKLRYDGMGRWQMIRFPYHSSLAFKFLNSHGLGFRV